MKKTLSACLAAILLLSLSIPAFAEAGGEGGSSRDDEFWAYTVEEIKASTTPVPFSTHVILLDKTHNFTKENYFALEIAKDVGCGPIILHPDTLEHDILDACQFNTWPNPDNQTAIDALNALANRTTDAEYKKFAQDVASAIKDNALGKILDKFAADQEANETGDKTGTTKQPETTPQPGGKFGDVDDSAWYANAVNYMASTGILNGYPDGTFKPNQPVTEAEFAVICWRLANVTDPVEAATTPIGGRDSDIDKEAGKLHYWINGEHVYIEHWGACYLYGALSAHWTSVSGMGGDKACNSPVLRGEAIDGIVELLDDLGMLDTEVKQTAKVWTGDDIPDWLGTAKELNGVHSVYTDDGKVAVGLGGYQGTGYETADGIHHSWTPLTILKAYNYGVTSGVDEKGTCNPAGTLTRGELCQILYNSQLNKPRDLVGRPGAPWYGGRWYQSGYQPGYIPLHELSREQNQK